MRFRHPDGSLVHLAYCTNVHPAEDLDGVLAQLSRFAEPVRRRLGPDRIGIGLWLAVDVARQLAANEVAVRRLRKELTRRGLEVVTLNGFPYRGFHSPVVKHQVYSPDWTDVARFDYTCDLAVVLAGLLPEDVREGSVSSLPLAWRTPWDRQRADTSSLMLELLTKRLTDIFDRTGRTIRIGMEPEPGCVIESTADAATHLAGVDTNWIGVCLDACHLAVGFEQPTSALARLDAAGLRVVKLQASCALEAPGGTQEALRAFVEPRFLHQTRERGFGGTDDLDEALDGGLPGSQPWRVHFHIPLHAEPAPPLASTRPVLQDTLAALFAGPIARTHHVEVETYTWQVLPSPPRTDQELIVGLAAELAWARSELLQCGLVAE